jgi:hypothetical protein
MRPRDSELRKRYRESVARLTASGVPVSLETVSGDLGVKFHTARNFLYRNPVLAKELGLATKEYRNGMEYLEAAERVVDRGEKLTGYTLAKELDRNHSAVYRFLRAHMSVRSLIYEATGIYVGFGEVPDCIVPRKRRLAQES